MAPPLLQILFYIALGNAIYNISICILTIVFHHHYNCFVIIYVCRYSYTFPFLDTKGMVVVDDDRVGPLYEHTFPPSLAPSLSFIGIPRKVIHFLPLKLCLIMLAYKFNTTSWYVNIKV